MSCLDCGSTSLASERVDVVGRPDERVTYCENCGEVQYVDVIR